MVTSDAAAFRILEIVAILFPLLIIVFQLFSQHFLAEDSRIAELLKSYLLAFVLVTYLLTAAVMAASTHLITSDFTFAVLVAVGVLYSALILIGLTMGYMGRELHSAIEASSQQIDLTQSVTEDLTTREQPEDESDEPRVE